MLYDVSYYNGFIILYVYVMSCYNIMNIVNKRAIVYYYCYYYYYY